MARYIEADELLKHKTDHEMISTHLIYNAPTVDVIPMELLDKAIDYVEEYICDKEKNTYRAQGMADALTMIERFIKENKDGSN